MVAAPMTRNDFTILSPFRVRSYASHTWRVALVLCSIFSFWYAARGSSFRRLFSRVCYPTRSRDREWSNPNALRSHITTQMTTTAFKIDLMELAMGMNELISHRMTPTTIKVNNTWTRGMIYSPHFTASASSRLGLS
jgi:hypothetical protein